MLRAEDIAACEEVALDGCPFSVSTLMREQNAILFATKPVKMRCMWCDLERQAARFGVPSDHHVAWTVVLEH